MLPLVFLGEPVGGLLRGRDDVPRLRVRLVEDAFRLRPRLRDRVARRVPRVVDEVLRGLAGRLERAFRPVAQFVAFPAGGLQLGGQPRVQVPQVVGDRDLPGEAAPVSGHPLLVLVDQTVHILRPVSAERDGRDFGALALLRRV